VLHGRADVLHAGHHRREREEFGIGALRDQARERGLAGARGAPQHHRVQLAARNRLAQRLTRSEQMSLTDELREGARPHPIGQRTQAIALGRRGAHPLSAQAMPSTRSM
jgi:hypothetical protein